MTQETINGLYSCKPGNEPQAGQIKTFVVEQRTGKSGKAYLKIKSAGAEFGGTPFRIVSAEPTGYTDKFGNISFNLEIEPVNGAPPVPEGNEASSTPIKPNPDSDGIMEAKKHLVQSGNLMFLAMNAARWTFMKYQDTHSVDLSDEQFQMLCGQLFKEVSSRRTTDGVNWWSYIDKMPTTPIP